MIAASIHWFNPLMYFIKKEINHACELACDEAVIKDFNLTEKQAYGDTLISVVAKHKYPIGVLQATMSEEKETLKERLVAIMQHNKKSKIIILVSLVLLIAVIIGAMVLGASIGKTNLIIYQNAQYGFSFSLPESWKDYTIVTDKWEGLIMGDSGEKTVEIGPMISIRHSGGTSENPWQGIPIMIFTLSQWDSLQQDKFHIGAAPIGPNELGRNSRYVFALPARYNVTVPDEEVENILNSNPLQPNEDINPDNQ